MCGKAEALEQAVLREKGERVLRVDAHLDGMPARFWSSVQRLAGGDPELLLDEIETRDQLGHGVLDLQARVQLDEPEALPGDEELGRPGALVGDRTGERDRRRGDRRSGARREAGRGCLLEHLLVTSLNRAVALAEGLDGTVAVGEELNLDVPRALDEALAEDTIVAERRQRLAAGRRERRLELVLLPDRAHAPAATSGGRLDDERQADLLGRSRRQRRNLDARGDPLRLELVGGEAHGARGRADPHEAGAAHRLCQRGALGQEAPAGVHGVGARLDGRLHEPVGVEVAADLPDVVGHAGVQRASIVGGHRRDRRHAEPPARARDADRHISPVCDEEPLDPPAHAFPRIRLRPCGKAGTLPRPGRR